MDCMYKTNKYRMSFLLLCGQIALHVIFYVYFCFMIKGTIEDYIWALQQLKAAYSQLELPDSTVVVTDMKEELMTAFFSVFQASII